MERLILRIDDITMNTDFEELDKILAYAFTQVPDLQVWMAVSVFSQTNGSGSVYADPPFKDRKLPFFFKVDTCIDRAFLREKILAKYVPKIRIVSHGLIHSDHSAMNFDAQAMSIVSSCSFLKTNIFVPPFNRFNKETLEICEMFKIKMIDFQDGWECLEFAPFDQNKKLFYIHPWRWNLEDFKQRFVTSQSSGPLPEEVGIV